MSGAAFGYLVDYFFPASNSDWSGKRNISIAKAIESFLIAYFKFSMSLNFKGHVYLSTIRRRFGRTHVYSQAGFYPLNSLLFSFKLPPITFNLSLLSHNDRQKDLPSLTPISACGS